MEKANCAILFVDKLFCCSTYYLVPIIFAPARGKLSFRLLFEGGENPSEFFCTQGLPGCEMAGSNLVFPNFFCFKAAIFCW